MAPPIRPSTRAQTSPIKLPTGVTLYPRYKLPINVGPSDAPSNKMIHQVAMNNAAPQTIAHVSANAFTLSFINFLQIDLAPDELKP